MHWLGRVIVALAANAAGLFLANKFIPGFVLAGDTLTLLKVAALLMVLNFFLKPVLTLIVTPIIVLTLGLGLIAVNALILYILDFLSANLTIQTTSALIWSSLLLALVNLVFHLFTRPE